MQASQRRAVVPERADDEITVLLVDDNEQWVELLSTDLESEGPFDTITVLDATEALLTLRDDPAIDCVVADYRMPEIDGLQLLERVREDWPNLPFILLTGMGSEDVASQAIRAGVSDYFRKDPRTHEVPLLANRIEQAVDQARLRAELEESEERYRTITDQVSEGIAIVRDGVVTFCNDRLLELTGYDRTALADADLVECLIAPDDRAAVTRTLSNATRTGEADSFHAATLQTADGRDREIEYSVRRLPYGAEPATILSIRDVTAKRSRERNLERERTFNRAVQRALIDNRTRQELESEVAALLTEDGYKLVWIGETEGERLHPTAVSGTDAYLDEIELAPDAGKSAEPSIWSARTSEPRFPGDLEEAFATTWRDQALEHGFRTAGALPLTYESVSYGVLSVYHEQPHHIDAAERELLVELSRTLAFAIHHIELKKSLSSDDMVAVELDIDATGYYLTELLSAPAVDVTDVEVSVRGTHPYDEARTIQYVELSGIDLETFRSVADEYVPIDKISVITDGEQPRLQLQLTQRPPELTIASYGGVVSTTTVTPDRARLRFRLQSRSDLDGVVSTLEEQYGPVTVRSCVATDRDTPSVGTQPVQQLASLTEKQATAVHAAYHHGYFDQPREHSAKEIAHSLGVVHSTYLQHLRAAQRKLFGTLFAAQEAPADE